MWDWEYNEAYIDSEWDMDYTPKCKHKWKATTLIVSVVYDCELCGAKKEEVENEKSTNG
jgi:hypothetical protein